MAWSKVQDGLPDAEDGAPFFCWAPGWDHVVVLEFFRKSADGSYLGGFGNSAGAWKEVTQWMAIEMPKLPKEAE